MLNWSGNELRLQGKKRRTNWFCKQGEIEDWSRECSSSRRFVFIKTKSNRDRRIKLHRDGRSRSRTVLVWNVILWWSSDRESRVEMHPHHVKKREVSFDSSDIHLTICDWSVIRCGGRLWCVHLLLQLCTCLIVDVVDFVSTASTSSRWSPLNPTHETMPRHPEIK